MAFSTKLDSAVYLLSWLLTCGLIQVTLYLTTFKAHLIVTQLSKIQLLTAKLNLSH